MREVGGAEMNGGETRILSHDVEVGGAVAFTRGEAVTVEAVEPNPERPEYKYVVYSRAVERRYQLREEDFEAPGPLHFAPGDAFQQGVMAQPPPGHGTPDHAPRQAAYMPPTVTRAMTSSDGKIMWFSAITGSFGLFILAGTFLPWLSFMGFRGGSGWDLMLHGGFGGFSLLIRGEGAIIFTGFWSIAVGIAVTAGGVLLFTRRTVGGWVARIAGALGGLFSCLTLITIYMHGLRAGVGLWLFLLSGVGSVIVGSVAMKAFD